MAKQKPPVPPTAKHHATLNSRVSKSRQRTKNIKNPSWTDGISFLALPGEIRNQIYHSFFEVVVSDARRARNSPGRYVAPKVVAIRELSNLFMSCKQIKAEAESLFYQLHFAELEGGLPLQSFISLQHIMRLLPRGKWASVNAVSLDIKIEGRDYDSSPIHWTTALTKRITPEVQTLIDELEALNKARGITPRVHDLHYQMMYKTYIFANRFSPGFDYGTLGVRWDRVGKSGYRQTLHIWGTLSSLAFLAEIEDPFESSDRLVWRRRGRLRRTWL